MPTLADIYSGIATAKRQAGNFIRQPVSTLQEIVALANDEARQLNRQTALSTQGARQELRGQPMTAEQAAADQALTQQMIDAMNVGGITGNWVPAFHGTTKNFKGFNPKKSFGDLGVIWTTPEESFAKRYAGEKGKVIPLEINEGKNFDFSNENDLKKLKEKAKNIDIYDPLRGMITLDAKVPNINDKGSYKSAEHPQLFNLLKKMGYDSVSVYEDGVRNIGFFKPQKNVRIKNGE